MQNSKLAKKLLTYLPLLAVMMIAVIGIFMGKDMGQPALETQVKTLTQVEAEENSLPLLTISGANRSCISPYIYTSLPPKCRTADGTFMQASGMPSNLMIMPRGK